MMHLFESVAGRKTGKYDMPEDNWQSLEQWLWEHGYTETSSIKKFDKEERTYTITAYDPNFKPYSMSIHVGKTIFYVKFDLSKHPCFVTVVKCAPVEDHSTQMTDTTFGHLVDELRKNK